jgi:TRAP-type C4-dicarboxylate transport system permease small subunit
VRWPRLVLRESARLLFAILVAYGSATAFESTCPPPTPENSSPGCEGLSIIFGAVVGFVGAIVLSIAAQLIWRRRKRRTV